jgi:general secretion pathway protein A
VSFSDLLKTICRESGLEVTTEDVFATVNHLHQVLIEEYKQGRNVALIVDEAQHMPIETLEHLRMLSNLETSTQKLIQIVLVGQPEFEDKLNEHALRQLKQRLMIQATISPLTDKESLEYIAHRLAKVRLTDAPIFTRGALRQIIKHAKGTPRVLNLLCSGALIQGFGERQHHISARIAKQVIADYRGKRSRRRWRLWMALTGTAALLTAWFLFSPYAHVVWSKIGYTGLLKHTPANITQSIASHSSTRMPPPQETTEAPRDSVPPLLERIPALPPEVLEREAPTTLTEVSEPTQAQAAPVTVRIVQRGDQIARLALEVYSSSSPAVLKWIKKNNPQLRSVHRIERRMQLTLPPLPPGVR